MTKPISTIALVIMFVLLFCRTSLAEMPLELIQVFQSDTDEAALMSGCMTAGDLDNDGFDEFCVAELGPPKRLLIYRGGNPPDTIPDMIIEGRGGIHRWMDDINGDGERDLLVKRVYSGPIEKIEVWLGCDTFLQKTEEDFLLRQSMDTFSAFGYTISSGDMNGDGDNDLIIASANGEIPGLDGRFSFYFGGPTFDTICDQVMVFYREGNNNDNFYNGTGLGDINGDGLVDLGYTVKGVVTDSSYFAIILGSNPIHTNPDYIITSPFLDYEFINTFGDTITPVGDINKDGYDDFIITGGTSWPCLFYGNDPFNPIPKILGDTSNIATTGDIIANIGDLNHDGWDDIGVGLPGYDFTSGIVYVYFGSSNMNTDIDLVFPWFGADPLPGREFGFSVGAAGDFNGDNVDDLAISARQKYFSPGERGWVYIYSGDTLLPTPAEDEPDVPLPSESNILKQNYPNPFNNGTIIEYSLWGVFEREIDLSIYNILGQKVRTLKNGIESGGTHTVYWDGKNYRGEDVSTGIYFYRLSSKTKILSKKMIYLK